MKVAVIVLNYQGAADTLACVRSLEAQTRKPDEVIVVDNASPDGSGAELRKALPEISHLQSPANLGFATGNNLGIRHALAQGAELVWLLNNDAVAAPDALEAMVKAASVDGRVGAWGTLIYEWHERTRLQCWGGGWANPWTGRSAEYRTPVPIERLDYVTGCSLFLRREALIEVGLLDEGYFMYFEDTDLGFRYRAAGWRLGVVEQARVWHKGGATSRLNAKQASWRTQSLMRFQQRHAPHYGAAAITATALRALSFAAHGQWRQLAWLGRDVRRFARAPDWR